MAMSAEEHRSAWMERYAAVYETDAEREQGYQDHQSNLAVMQRVFGLEATA